MLEKRIKRLENKNSCNKAFEELYLQGLHNKMKIKEAAL